jgi:ABC-2 type transport system ATP-binding protein
MPGVIEVNNLSKVFRSVRRKPGIKNAFAALFKPDYSEVKAVDSIRFSIAKGELVGFLGPNGAGKTTTLKMLAGLLYPTSGEARVLGYLPWERQDDYRRQFALVMGQKNQLWWDLPAMDSLVLNSKIYGVSAAVLKSKVEELTVLLDVGHRLHAQVRELSLGERMKFELIACLLHDPKVLFLDEPTIGLDVVSQQKMREFLKNYNASHQTTILLTSHNMADIKGVCSRVLLINHGSLMFDGPLAGLVEKWSAAKHITLTASRDLARAELSGYGEVVELNGVTANLKISRDKVPQIAAAMLAALPLVDLTVEDPPIEEVVADVFRALPGREAEKPR